MYLLWCLTCITNQGQQTLHLIAFASYTNAREQLATIMPVGSKYVQQTRHLTIQLKICKAEKCILTEYGNIQIWCTK